MHLHLVGRFAVRPIGVERPAELAVIDRQIKRFEHAALFARAKLHLSHRDFAAATRDFAELWAYQTKTALRQQRARHLRPSASNRRQRSFDPGPSLPRPEARRV